ncbi:hypothetical protein KTT_48540 [Tengunoibacter tsumagoiensis]|uniref:Polymerase beta nucleotidyltransferase domain-containing protein n=2 Tax=Tengunoibacter tsumagoiensis TaxID=2014871 RepID=A0A402A7G7_9CHLR|nr:hypothetical protein KTT_48540 [Tengunoibacter tsumagoiensis]
MTLPNWVSPSVRMHIQMLSEHLQTLLNDNLIGVYLHGSLAMNCFNPQHNDLDLLVLNQHQIFFYF